jgi:hypothetical protein
MVGEKDPKPPNAESAWLEASVGNESFGGGSSPMLTMPRTGGGGEDAGDDEDECEGTDVRAAMTADLLLTGRAAAVVG